MKTNKQAYLLYSFEDSDWASCRKIVSNLAASYTLAQPGIKFLNYSRLFSEQQLLSLTEELILAGPETIIFADHQPYPADLLSYLLPRLTKPTHFIIHAYGDFLIPYPEKWLKVNEGLKRHKLTFVAASLRHARMLEQFLRDDSVAVCPFPVNPKEFYFDSDQKKNLRSHLGVKDEFCWLYTGRLSHQKNILQLITSFARYLKNTGAQDRLWLAGPFDSMGVPYLKFTPKDHEYFHEYHQTLQSLPTPFRERIHYLGIKYGEELNQLYSAADGFVSISTHNDEDYGMAVAEAQTTGLPCVLTDWAGYSGFSKTAPATTHLVPVRLKAGRLEYDDHKLAQGFWRFSRGKSLDRQSNSTLSLDTLSKELALLLSQETKTFSGFSSELEELCEVWKREGFSSQNGQYSSYYQKIYRCYFE